jgi:hypothetical protein
MAKSAKTRREPKTPSGLYQTIRFIEKTSEPRRLEQASKDADERLYWRLEKARDDPYSINALIAKLQLWLRF